MSHASPSSHRIRHFVAPAPMAIAEVLERHLRLDKERAGELHRLGAIYKNRRRVFADEPLAKGDYLRVHLQPKRFRLPGIDWTKRVVLRESAFLIVDKPSGVPTHATLDNWEENLLFQMRRALGEELWVTQRLDIETSGLLLLARTKMFQAWFNDELAGQRVEKKYRALVEGRPATGRLVHYMRPDERSPKELSEFPQPGWLSCELSILGVRAETIRGTSREREGSELDITLHTGRTHQIRAQLAAIGSPVVGDRLYGGRRHPFFGLQCRALSFTYRGRRYQAGLPAPGTWRLSSPGAEEALPVTGPEASPFPASAD